MTRRRPASAGDMGNSGADPGFLKGGGVQARIQDFSQAPPPLGHCPRDVIHVPRGGGHLRSTSKKGGGPTLGPMLKSLHRGPAGPPGSATVMIEYTF